MLIARRKIEEELKLMKDSFRQIRAAALRQPNISAILKAGLINWVNRLCYLVYEVSMAGVSPTHPATRGD